MRVIWAVFLGPNPHFAAPGGYWAVTGPLILATLYLAHGGRHTYVRSVHGCPALSHVTVGPIAGRFNADRPRSGRNRGSARSDGFAAISGALPEPGAFAARLRRQGARHGRRRLASPSRAGALPRDPGRERRPVFPGPGRRPERAGPRRPAADVARRDDDRRAAPCHSPAGGSYPPAKHRSLPPPGGAGARAARGLDRLGRQPR